MIIEIEKVSLRKNIEQAKLCQNGLYIPTIIINAKLLHDLKSLKHQHFIYVNTCSVNIQCIEYILNFIFLQCPKAEKKTTLNKKKSVMQVLESIMHDNIHKLHVHVLNRNKYVEF